MTLEHTSRTAGQNSACSFSQCFLKNFAFTAAERERRFVDNIRNLKPNNDKVLLSGIKIRPHLGVDASERKNPQDCTADVTVWGNCEAGASSDDLKNALDYAQILAKIFEIVNCREYALLETLAYSITRGVLQTFPVAKVSVKVRKYPAALAGKLDYVQVEIEESR